MTTGTKKAALVVGLLLVGAAAGLVLYQGTGSPSSCSPQTSDVPTKYQARTVRFGAVTEYCLDAPSRWSNGLAVAPDGSVWFGEQSVPGLGRLFPNGTVTEYPWPRSNGSATKITGYKTGIWGVSFWNGRAWATDGDRNLLLGIDPRDGSAVTIDVNSSAPFPYTMAPGPDGSLWFTSLSGSAKLGRLDTTLGLTVYPVAGLGGERPLQVDFVNATFAYMVALDQSGSGHLYRFDPQVSTSSIEAVRLGGVVPLASPDSVSAFGRGVWVVQHFPSSILGYDPTAGSWTTYPTSTISYEPTTLPYFVEATSAGVWFNEHYANRIALLDPEGGTLTEYSEANPQITSGTQIQNDLTIASVPDGLWFTSITGNYIGFISLAVAPSFAISTEGSNRVSMAANGARSIQLQVKGEWPTALQVHVSDSENYTSIPSLISIVPDRWSIPAGSGPMDLSVLLSTKAALRPGEYTVGVTVSDGLVSQTAYLFLTVT